MTMSISKILLEEYSVSDAVPGKKATCPICKHKTLQIKWNDELAKCFHSSCKWYTNLRMHEKCIESFLQRIIYSFYQASHNKLTETTNDAYQYLLQKRKLHPKVIFYSMIGVVPTEYDFDTPSTEVTLKSNDILAELNKDLSQAKSPKDQDLVSMRIDNHNKSVEKLTQDIEKMKNIVHQCGGWIMFFYTDQNLNITKIRLRKPFAKEFRSIQLGKNSGVFGYNLLDFSKESDEENHITASEGEFNSLTAQSILLNTFETEGINLDEIAYLDIISLGSASDVDFNTLISIDTEPVIAYDNDSAGFAVVEKAKELMHLSAYTVPEPSNDLDEYLTSFGDDYNKALQSLYTLVDSRKNYFRNIQAVEKEVTLARKQKLKDFLVSKNVTSILLSDLKGRARFYTDGSLSYIFNRETKRLFEVDPENIDLIKLLFNFGINKAEPIFKYIINAFNMEAVCHGTVSQVHKLSYYDNVQKTLYIYNNAGSVYKVTPDSIELVDNGTDNILMIHNESWETFVLTEISLERSYLDDIIINKVNFDTDSTIFTLEELRLLLRYWFFSIFFESIMPTKAIAAFIGEQGSGKTFTFKKVGLSLKGKNFGVMQLPDKQDDFDVAVANEHLLIIDNADTKCAWLEDKLATLATGSVMKRRKLYTNTGTIDMIPHCFLGITSRSPHFRRSDVAERIILFRVKKVEVKSSEFELLDEVTKNRNVILSEVIYSLQNILKTFRDNKVSYSGEVRMADFANFMLNAGIAERKVELVNSVLEKIPNAQAEFSLEVDPVVDLLVSWSYSNSGKFVTYEELCSELTLIAADMGVTFNYKGRHASFAQKMKSLKSTLEKLFNIDERSIGAHRTKRSFEYKQALLTDKLY